MFNELDLQCLVERGIHKIIAYVETTSANKQSAVCNLELLELVPGSYKLKVFSNKLNRMLYNDGVVVVSPRPQI